MFGRSHINCKLGHLVSTMFAGNCFYLFLLLTRGSGKTSGACGQTRTGSVELVNRSVALVLFSGLTASHQEVDNLMQYMDSLK